MWDDSAIKSLEREYVLLLENSYENKLSHNSYLKMKLCVKKRETLNVLKSREREIGNEASYSNIPISFE